MLSGSLQLCVPEMFGVLLNSQSIRKRLFPMTWSNLSQVFIIVVVCFWLIHIKEIECQNLIMRNLLIKTKCYNEPDSVAPIQPFSLAVLNGGELNLNWECLDFNEFTF